MADTGNGPNPTLFKKAIRSTFELQVKTTSRVLKNIKNIIDPVEQASDMLRPVEIDAVKNYLGSSSLKENKMSPESSPDHISFPNVSHFQPSPASSSGYFSASDESFDHSASKRTPRSSFAHPDFQGFKFTEPDKTSTYEFTFSPPIKSNYHSTSARGICRGLSRTYETEEKSSRTYKPEEKSSITYKPDEKSSTVLQPVDNLFSFDEASYFDTHCHLDFLGNRTDSRGSFSDYMLENKSEFPPSFGGCIAVFCNPYSFRKRYSWEKHLKHDKVWASFGCHPKNAETYDEVIEEDLIKALDHPKVRAVGEIGLDYSERSLCHKDKQKEVFRRQIWVAKARHLPLVIHCRDAYDDCLEILEQELPRDYPIHLHCFTSHWCIADKYLKAFPNLYIGITNLVTFPSATEVHEVAKNIPLSRLLLETDAPYFVPTALSKNVKIAHPGMAIFVAKEVAMLRGESLKDVVTMTRYNTKWLYNV